MHNVFLTIEYFQTRTKYDEYTETALLTLICVHNLHKLYYSMIANDEIKCITRISNYQINLFK